MPTICCRARGPTPPRSRTAGPAPWRWPTTSSERRRAAAPLALILLLALAACAPGRGLEALRVLDDLAAGTGPSDLKAGTPAPRRTAFSYPAAGERRRGDLYRPGRGRTRAGLVLVPGATPRGKDDPRLVAFARTLARARFAVLVPEIAGLRRLRLGPEQAGEVAAAIEALARAAGTASEPALGLVAISYAAGPALIAALERGAQAHLGFIVLIGPYHDIEAAIAYVTTGFYRPRPGAEWRRGAPDPTAKWVFLAGNARRLEAAADRRLLRRIARRKRRDPAADVAALAAGLGPAGRAVYALVANDDPARVPALIKALPAPVRRDVRALDLARLDLGRLGPRTIIAHGRDDPVIPAAQGRALARALPAGRVELFVADSLRHVRLGGGGPGDAVTLWRAVYAVLAAADAAPAPCLSRP